MNVFMNKIDEQYVSKRQRRYGVTECTNELTCSKVTSNIYLLIQWNEWVNLLIQRNEAHLIFPKQEDFLFRKGVLLKPWPWEVVLYYCCCYSVWGCAASDLLSSYSALNCSFSLTLSISALHEKPPTSPPPPPQGGTKTTRLRLTLRLKDDTLQRPTHEDIFEITHTKLDCFLTGIRDINNGGFSVTSDMQSTIDSLVSPKGRQELAKINLAPVPSPKIMAERTVFISWLSRHVGDRPAIEI